MIENIGIVWIKHLKEECPLFNIEHTVKESSLNLSLKVDRRKEDSK